MSAPRQQGLRKRDTDTFYTGHVKQPEQTNRFGSTLSLPKNRAACSDCNQYSFNYGDIDE